MATKPTDLPIWATSASADISTPPTPSQESGWLNGATRVRPPASWFNWWQNLTYQWILWFDARTVQYDTLEELIAGTAAGESAELVEYDLAVLPGTTLATVAAGATVVDVAADGTYVYHATAAAVKRYTRTGGVLTTTYTPTNAGAVRRVSVNGEIVVVAYGNYLECFEAAGTSRWVVNHGAAVYDVALDGTRAYMVGAASTNTQVRALTLSTGASNWTYQHGGGGGAETLYSVATDGRSVFIAGDASGLASTANVRALNASNGTDFNGESTSAADTAGLAWNAIAASVIISGGCVAVDDQRIYLGFQSAVTIESRSKITGAVLSTVTPPSSMVVNRLAVDQDLLLAASSSSGDVLVALAKADLSTQWRYAITGGGYATTDGAGVFVSNGSNVYQVSRGNRAGRWVRVDPADLGLPFRWLAIPQR